MGLSSLGLEASIFPYAPYPQQVEFMKDVSLVVGSGGVLIAEACNGFGKTVCALSSALEMGKSIFYATRTHEQARQVLQEVEVINGKSGRSFSAVSLAGRRHLCMDRVCRSLPPVESSEVCRLMRETGKCPYRSEVASLPGSLPKVLSIQKLQSQGRALRLCPYFLARKAAETSAVTVAPYQYVFNEAIRSKAKLTLTDKVLIFDEAHNADKIGLDALSDSISERGLSNAVKELELVEASPDLIDRLRGHLEENVSEEAVVKTGLELMTAQELFEKRQSAKRITTASKNLDNLLGGGVETQAITEFIGEYGAGKSQICMQLCVTAQQPPEQGGLGGKVLFLDTEGTFAPQRVNDIAKAKGLDQKKTLEKILYARCYNSDHQMFLVDKASKIIEEEGIKLVVVDSLISHFRGEYVGREMLAERQQRLNQHIHKLLRLAELYNCAVVVTNQIQSNPTAFFGDPNRPAGGNVVAHASTHRLYIRKGKAQTRVAHVIDSPYLPGDQCRFAITAMGIEDVEES